MLERAIYILACLLLIYIGPAYGADVILNEYNAVSSSNFLNGGDAMVDEDGGYASDSYFGRVQGNGGDWFELVVITDHLDMRYWKLDIWVNGHYDERLNITGHSIWSNLRSGTIITVSEDVPDDVSYDPAAGDWWINVRANNDGSGIYIENSNFPVNNDNWQLEIKDLTGAVIFGPVGEGVSPISGVGNDEIFRLEADPSALITPDSNDYDDGKNLSTFGSPNKWGYNEQNLRILRGYSLADFDESSTVDAIDFRILAKAWLSTLGTADWNPVCDISQPADYVINEFDLSVFTEAWLVQQGP